MQRRFDVTFSASGEKTITLYDEDEESARRQAGHCTWDDIISGDDGEDVAADLNVWFKIEVATIKDMGELPPPRPSLYSNDSIQALRRVLGTYGAGAFKTYDGSVDHPYRDVYKLAMVLGGQVAGPSPDELDIMRGDKPGEIKATVYSCMALQEIVEEMLSMRMRMVRVMDDDESAISAREEYRRLLKELRFRDHDEVVAEWTRQTRGANAT